MKLTPPVNSAAVDCEAITGGGFLAGEGTFCTAPLHHMRMFKSACILAAIAVAAPLQAQYAPSVPPANGLIGYWSTDAGSVLHVDHCGSDVCITIVTISKKAPGVIDERNPDASLRSRPVCKIDIGTGFKLKDPDHAEDGKVYDPESGKTYKSVMSSDGNTLHLRGYIGFKALGRTETWTRTSAQYATCVGTTHR